jgi:hypothetical protein
VIGSAAAAAMVLGISHAQCVVATQRSSQKSFVYSSGHASLGMRLMNNGCSSSSCFLGFQAGHNNRLLRKPYRWRPSFAQIRSSIKTVGAAKYLLLLKASASATEGVAANTADPIAAESTPTSRLTSLQSQDESFHAGGPAAAVYESSTTSVAAAQSSLPLHLRLHQMTPVDQAFFLLGFIACLTTGVLTALLMTAIPTLNAMRRAAISMEKLADVAREELPSTMAAIRLSGMEISDLTLELNDLSQEISDGVRSSARAVQAAEVGIRRMGALAASQTICKLVLPSRNKCASV